MKLENIAQVAHELNMAYCESIGDTTQPTWADAPEWQKSLAQAKARRRMEIWGGQKSRNQRTPLLCPL